MSKLNTYVHVHDEDGVSHAFGPDDTVPAWAAARITNPGVWAVAPTEEDQAAPSGAPEGSAPEGSAAEVKASENGEPEGGEPETVELPEGDITDEWTVKQLKAYAKSESIDLGDAKSKAEILAKLAE